MIYCNPVDNGCNAGELGYNIFAKLKMSLIYLTSAKYMLPAFAFFKASMSKKHLTRMPSSSQQQKTDNSSIAVISVHSSVMTLKSDRFEAF